MGVAKSMRMFCQRNCSFATQCGTPGRVLSEISLWLPMGAPTHHSDETCHVDALCHSCFSFTCMTLYGTLYMCICMGLYGCICLLLGLRVGRKIGTCALLFDVTFACEPWSIFLVGPKVIAIRWVYYRLAGSERSEMNVKLYRHCFLQTYFGFGVLEEFSKFQD